MVGGEYDVCYVFERFPSFTQTFCAREVEELGRQGVRALVFSLRDTGAEEVRHFTEELRSRVVVLPQGKELVSAVEEIKGRGELAQEAVLALRYWGERPDKRRAYEAAWIGHQLGRLDPHGRVRHAHCHFAGMAARCCWWLRQFTGLSYSVTGHANDLFVEAEAVSVGLAEVLGDAAAVATVSEYTAGLLRGRYAGAAARVHRVYNGLDMAPYVEAREAAEVGGRGSARGGITSVGRLIEKKGFGDLVRACGLLREQGVDFCCRIVGEGPLEGELRGLVAELGLEDRVSLMGARSQEEIVRLLAEETQVFALACVTEADGGKDNLPTVIMEAMAAALPVVSTRLAGVPEMVEEGETGLLCEEGDVAGLAERLARLLGDEALCRAYGEAGQLLCHALFSREVAYGELRRVLVGCGGLPFGRVFYGGAGGGLVPGLKGEARRRWCQLRWRLRPRGRRAEREAAGRLG